MATIPPLVISRATPHWRADGESWLTFNLMFVLAVSGLVNILLVVRLVTLR